MKLLLGNLVEVVNTESTPVYSAQGIPAEKIGAMKLGELGVVVAIGDQANTQVKVLTSLGVLGWVTGAWLKKVV